MSQEPSAAVGSTFGTTGTVATKTARSRQSVLGNISRTRLAIFVILVGLIAATGFLFVRTDPVTVLVGNQNVEYRCGPAIVDLALDRPQTVEDLETIVPVGAEIVDGVGACGVNATDRLQIAAVILLASVVIAAIIARFPLLMAAALIAIALLWGLDRFDSYPLALGLAVAIALIAAVFWLLHDD